MKVTALALDPIEKKPLARYKPGSMILSVGGLGCTMRCPWCQNHTIAQPEDPALVPVREMSIDELVEKARALVDEGNIGLAYTYNEPLVHWREVVECARAVHEAELDNVLVTNGLIAADKLEQLLPHIDAYNIDLKGFDQSVYDITGGKLETVKNTIERANEDAHVEVTTLLIPGLNDDMELLEEEATWLASVNPDIPLHLTRFFPQYRYADRPASTRSHSTRPRRSPADTSTTCSWEMCRRRVRSSQHAPGDAPIAEAKKTRSDLARTV